MSIGTLSPAALLPVEEARPSHVRWSELNGEFLDYVERHPEYRVRETFASLWADPWLRSFCMQSWPLFIGTEQRRELGRIAVGMNALVKEAMQRFLKGDPARVLDFYRGEGSNRGRRGPLAFSSNEFMLSLLLEEPDGIVSAPTRGDYAESPEGLKLLEYNAGFLGAMQLDGIGEQYLACPPIARFLEEKGRRARAPETLTALFRHLVDQTVRMGIGSGEPFNAAILLWPNDEDEAAMFVEEMYERALGRALQERAMPGGRVFFCGMEDFRIERNALFVGEHPVQLVLEHHNGLADQRSLFRLFKMGRINLVSGPIGYILSDKRNLALISQNAESDEFTAGERALIERHLPWTRTVRPALTTYRGRSFRLPDDLADRRQEFVLKKASSLGGRYVRVGRFRTDAEWREDLAQAAAEADWIVQEYVEQVPYYFQNGERGAVRHDMVWGLFAFGEHFGETFLRVLPHGRGSGVVNAEQGAQISTFLNLDDEPVDAAAPRPAALPAEEARPVHARWSELNVEFLDHVARNPEYLARESFASLNSHDWLRKLSIQPWPLFMGPEQRREVERVALGMDRLVKGVLERFLGNDPARIVEFYRANVGVDGSRPFVSHMNEFILEMLLEEPSGIESAPSRADYMEDAEGLKCLEYNAGSYLGGFHATPIGELYLECPPVARFLEEKRRRARAPDTVAALFRHLVDETVRMGAWSGGDFNVALVSRPHVPERLPMHPEHMYGPPLRRVLAARGMPGGRFFSCGAEDFRIERGALFVGEHPVQLVIEHHDGSADLRPLFRLFKVGRINFVSGPISEILSDKRNLALLSEHARSDELTADERALLERYLPWTRIVRPGQTHFRGRGFRLPDDLAGRREEFVLKKATSLGGSHVRVGRFRTDAEWRDDLSRAVQEGDWVVQEYLAPLPYCFQAGEHGAERHDMVWGLFAFGGHFGGAFLRMQRRGGGGVVNTRQGAEVGVFLELEE